MGESSESASNQKSLEQKYQELKVKSQRMKKHYKKQLQELEESKTRALEELRGCYEAKLQEKASQLQLFSSLQEDLEESKMDIERMKVEEEILQKRIEFLKEDIQDLNNVIEERDKTILEKNQQLEKRKHVADYKIQDLKKEIQLRDEELKEMKENIQGNQELEKRKHVADYKIQDLKKEIELCDEELKEKIQGMDNDLQYVHLQSIQLEFNISQLRKKLYPANQETLNERQKELEKRKHVADYKIQDLKKEIELRDEELKEKIQGMDNDLQYVHLQSIQLEFNISQLRKKLYPANQETLNERQKAVVVGADVDIREEYAQQREHLQRGVSTPQKQVKNERETQREGSMQVMQENVTLKETNELRQELKRRTKVQNLEAVWHRSKKNGQIPSADSKGSGSVGPKSSAVLRVIREKETAKITKLPPIENKGLMHSQKLPAGSVPSRVGKLPALRMPR